MADEESKTLGMTTEEWKDLSNKVVHKAKTAVHYGWIPYIIYLGMTTDPRPPLVALLGL